MSSDSSNVDLSGLIERAKEGLRLYLPISSDKTLIASESTALLQVSYAALKCLPYSLFSSTFGLNDLSQMLSTRVVFFEAALVCLVSTVHNVFFAIIYTILSIPTLGMFGDFYSRCRVHWSHVFYGISCTTLASIGVATPKYGTGAIGAYMLYMIAGPVQDGFEEDVSRYETDIIDYVKEMAHDYSHIVYSWVRSWVKNEAAFYDYKDTLTTIEERILAANRIEDLKELAWYAFRELPKRSPQAVHSPLSRNSTTFSHRYQDV